MSLNIDINMYISITYTRVVIRPLEIIVPGDDDVVRVGLQVARADRCRRCSAWGGG